MKVKVIVSSWHILLLLCQTASRLSNNFEQEYSSDRLEVESQPDGYFFSNILDIKSSIFSLDFINPSNQKRLDLIFKLHKEGKTNKEIVHHLKIHKIKRRNKDDNYSVKDVFMCIKKLKKREERMKDIKYKLGKWKLWREY